MSCPVTSKIVERKDDAVCVKTVESPSVVDASLGLQTRTDHTFGTEGPGIKETRPPPPYVKSSHIRLRNNIGE